MSDPKRIAIVDDDPVMSCTLLEIFGEENGFSVVLACSTAEDFMEQVSNPEVSLDLALIDLGLPGMKGQELIAWFRAEHPQTPCIAHTVFEDKKNVLSALRAGAAGYLLKGLNKDQLLQSLRTLEQGGAPLTPKIARFLVTEFQTVVDNPLSQREQEVLALLGQGFSYKECAQSLTVSVHTVHDHVKRIYSKLKVQNKRQAVQEASHKGWL